jgi:ribonuclease BN (tRNA processing enzyme)
MRKRTRRDFLQSLATAAFASTALGAFGAEKKPTRLILLGTKGGPRVAEEGRRNCSVAIVINGVPYVVDCGYGTSRQLLAAGIPLQSVRYAFVTHHHSDHNLELGPIFYNAWVTGSPARADVYGPPGTIRMMKSFFEYLKFDIDTRIVDEGRPDLRESIFAHDIDKAGVVLTNDDVRVTAALVKHPPIQHAFAYRFDAADRSIVISGDTAYSEALVELAKGADVLVHEVMHRAGIEALLKRIPNAARLREHLMVSHTFPEEVGKVAAAAGVKTLVLYHFVPGDANLSDEEWAAGVRQHYKGRIIVGKDLMEV